MLLVLAAAALSSMCLRSLRHALESAQAAEELQRRWGMVSCQAALLPRAERVLAQAEQETASAAATCRHELRLGAQVFELVFSDEQAKVNVNRVFRADGKLAAE
ncbi:MAG TPA: hypothetical protein VLH09_02740, partial [Bryobacteraceae bacterium]|nr:hypothetical protein [Bryobacteraceae bacterium]